MCQLVREKRRETNTGREEDEKQILGEKRRETNTGREEDVERGLEVMQRAMQNRILKILHLTTWENSR